MYITLAIALSILLFGTISYIFKEDRGQAPVRLMSPSTFPTPESLGEAMARRFWPHFQGEATVRIGVSSDVSSGAAVWKGVEAALNKMQADTRQVRFEIYSLTTDGPTERDFVKNEFNWYVLPLPLDVRDVPTDCEASVSFDCSMARAARRNFKKRRGSDQYSAVIEDHHKNNLYLFVHEPN